MQKLMDRKQRQSSNILQFARATTFLPDGIVIYAFVQVDHSQQQQLLDGTRYSAHLCHFPALRRN